MTLLLLILAGALGGFVAGLIGVGGGIIFAPVLFFTFQGMGVEDPVLTPLTIGSSLLCTGAASLSGAVQQARAGAIDRRSAMIMGSLAALSVTLTGVLVTTQPWYNKHAFQLVLGTLLLVVLARILLKRRTNRSAETDQNSIRPDKRPRSAALLGGGGLAAGALASAAGIGGGVLMVPALASRFLKLPLKVATATSTTAIVLISLTGVIVYALRGWGAPTPPGAIGYVDPLHAAALFVPAIFTAPLGVRAAHRSDVKLVRYVFAAFALIVAVRMLWDALPVLFGWA